ncbi:MAG: LptF/LptG family permease [Planctomycetia bacterium]|nr:LptF/LptG family permease [Planctomycetia bacterium]
MTILTRYVFFNVFLIFILGMLVLTFGFACFTLSEAVVMQNLPFLIACKIIPYALPEILRITIPVTLLLGACFFFAKMTSNNEIIALKAMGIPVWRTMVPIWIFALLMSLLCIWCNDLTFSWGRPHLAKVVLEGLEGTILNTLKVKKKFTSPDGEFTLEVSGVREDKLLLDPVLTNRKGLFQGNAQSARLTIDIEQEIPQIRIDMQATVFEGTGGGAILPRDFSHTIKLPQLASGNTSSNPSLGKVKETLNRIESERSHLRRELAAKATFALMTGSINSFGDGNWAYRKGAEEGLDYRKNRALLASPRCWSSGFTCFFFVWVGIPLAVWLNRPDFLLSFFICFFGVLVIYYPLMMFGVWGAKNGTFSPQFVWFGNIVLGFVGFWLLKKINKH